MALFVRIGCDGNPSERADLFAFRIGGVVDAG